MTETTRTALARGIGDGETSTLFQPVWFSIRRQLSHQNRQTLDKSGFTHINKELCSELPSGVPNIARRAFRAFYQSDFEVS